MSAEPAQPGGAVYGPAMQLAIEEAMLRTAGPGVRVRTWEFSEPVVVLGRSSRVDQETDRAFCDSQGIQVFRRCSGGATVVGGPGCLMYTTVISREQYPELGMVDAAHRFVMQRVLAATQSQIPDTQLQGICDLTWRNRKFSGNATRITRDHVLYHGTVLYAADLGLIERCLDFAPRQPEYRMNRPHGEFVTNVPIDPSDWANALAEQFDGCEVGINPDAIDLARELTLNRYSQVDWRFRH